MRSRKTPHSEAVHQGSLPIEIAGSRGEPRAAVPLRLSRRRDLVDPRPVHRRAVTEEGRRLEAFQSGQTVPELLVVADGVDRQALGAGPAAEQRDLPVEAVARPPGPEQDHPAGAHIGLLPLAPPDLRLVPGDPLRAVRLEGPGLQDRRTRVVEHQSLEHVADVGVGGDRESRPNGIDALTRYWTVGIDIVGTRSATRGLCSNLHESY